MKTILRGMLITAAISILPGLSTAQEWKPTKPVTIVVPVAPGSSNDMIARIMAERMTSTLGQPVLVENRPGAAGMLGAAQVVRSEPDGHTLLIAPSNIYIVPHFPAIGTSVKLNPLKDLTPVINAGTAPLLIVAHPSINVKTPRELITYLRNNAPVSYATSGAGSPMHIAGEMLQRSTGIKMTHIPYKGVMPGVNAVLSAEVPIGFTALAGAAPFIAAGKLVPIALIEKQRSYLLPMVPTLTESGIAGVEVSTYFQILAPGRTPAPIIQRFNKEMNTVLITPDVKEKLRNSGVQLMGGSSADAAKLARETYAKYGAVVKDLKIVGE